MTDLANSALLGVNIDHVATLRQARGTDYPSALDAALLAEEAGADYITAHLREDRRHIQDFDIDAMQAQLQTHLNLEMAVTDEMLAIAERVQPQDCCLVPEKRQELTTEGGLDVVQQLPKIREACDRLAAANVRVSLFVDADMAQIDAAKSANAPVIEIHTGHYANAEATDSEAELKKILQAADYAQQLGLIVNAGHGLHCGNVAPIAACPLIQELNIGHAIIGRAVFVGISQAVAEMKQCLQDARA